MLCTIIIILHMRNQSHTLASDIRLPTCRHTRKLEIHTQLIHSTRTRARTHTLTRMHTYANTSTLTRSLEPTHTASGTETHQKHKIDTCFEEKLPVFTAIHGNSPDRDLNRGSTRCLPNPICKANTKHTNKQRIWVIRVTCNGVNIISSIRLCSCTTFNVENMKSTLDLQVPFMCNTACTTWWPLVDVRCEG